MTGFRWLLGINLLIAFIGLGVLVLICSLSGLSIAPGVYVYSVIVGVFIGRRVFEISREEDVTVRCGLFGHKMLNVRLDQGVRTYKCKRKRCLETERRVA